jgi:hypothetical protein
MQVVHGHSRAEQPTIRLAMATSASIFTGKPTQSSRASRPGAVRISGPGRGRRFQHRRCAPGLLFHGRRDGDSQCCPERMPVRNKALQQSS